MSVDLAFKIRNTANLLSAKLDRSLLALNEAEMEKLPVRLSEISAIAGEMLSNQVPQTVEYLQAHASEMTEERITEIKGLLETLALKATLVHLSTRGNVEVVHLSEHLFQQMGANRALSVDDVLEYMLHVVTGEDLQIAENPAVNQ